MIKDFIGTYINSGVLFDGTFGLEIETEAPSSYKIKEYSFWDVKNDGSLRDFGKEYVLKVPLRFGEELDAALNEFKTKTAGIPFHQNSISTSVHIHVNVLPETWRTLANFLTIYTLTENILIEYSGEFRRNNLFCLPIRSVPYVQQLINTIFENVEKKNYKFSRKLEQEYIKYAALNLGTLYRFGSIEIRSFRGTTDINLIRNWVEIQNNILEFSRQDITPQIIMDSFRDQKSALLKDIFKDKWKHLQHPAEEILLRPNLWYAGTIAYAFTNEQWNSLDTLPKQKDSSYPPDKLNVYAKMLFGPTVKYNTLSPEEQKVVKLAIDKDQEWELTDMTTTTNWESADLHALANIVHNIPGTAPQLLTPQPWFEQLAVHPTPAPPAQTVNQWLNTIDGDFIDNDDDEGDEPDDEF